MSRKERVREILSQSAADDLGAYLEGKTREGWQLAAVEWEREAQGEDPQEMLHGEVPYGLQVADDCLHLIENPAEREVLTVMLQQLIADKPLSAVAIELNQRGHRTRSGHEWSQLDIFNLFPRLIEVAPQIYPSEDWAAIRRRGLLRVAG